MSFVKSPEELQLGKVDNYVLFDAEVLAVYFETSPETIERLLPPPLRPASAPLAGVFVANYPRTSFGVSYRECALSLQVNFDKEEGTYFLAMPVTNDMALIGGREMFGYPKKIADIHMKREGDRVEGWAERRGTRFLEVAARLSGRFNDEAAQKDFLKNSESSSNLTVFNFKYFPSATLQGFDYNPRLIREEIEVHTHGSEAGSAELALRSSDHDPWRDVEVRRVLGATYSVGDNTMLPGSVVAEVDQRVFAPYSVMNLDILLASNEATG